MAGRSSLLGVMTKRCRNGRLPRRFGAWALSPATKSRGFDRVCSMTRFRITLGRDWLGSKLLPRFPPVARTTFGLLVPLNSPKYSMRVRARVRSHWLSRRYRRGFLPGDGCRWVRLAIFSIPCEPLNSKSKAEITHALHGWKFASFCRCEAFRQSLALLSESSRRRLATIPHVPTNLAATRSLRRCGPRAAYPPLVLPG